MKNSSSNNENMKYYLLSQQDLQEIYWCYELLIGTIIEKLELKEIKQEPDSSENE